MININIFDKLSCITIDDISASDSMIIIDVKNEYACFVNNDQINIDVSKIINTDSISLQRKIIDMTILSLGLDIDGDIILCSTWLTAKETNQEI